MNEPEDTESFQSFKKSPYFSMKSKNYFGIYDHLFSSYRGQEITFVEIGILQGGSLFMWRDFFGPQARIIGIDLNPDAKRWEEHGFEIFIGDQSKSEFWREFAQVVPSFDVLLDDGGHTNLQQLVTLVETAKIVDQQGLIVIEDTHSSYQKEFGNPGRFSFINVSKRLIDAIHSQFDKRDSTPGDLGRIVSIEYFNSIVAFKFGAATKEGSSIVNNAGIHLNNTDFRYANHSPLIRILQKVEGVLSFNYNEVGKSRSNLRFLNFLVRNVILKESIRMLLSPIHKLIQSAISVLLKYETFNFISKQNF